jgi:hypothetical protein
MQDWSMDLTTGTTFDLRLSVKQLGRKKALATREYAIGNFNSAPTLRELIERIVLLEVDAFRQRQNDQQLLRVLTEAQIADAAETGKISAGGQELKQDVNTDEAVATAIQAFKDGLYYVFYGDTQIERLDDTVMLELQQELMFLRLVALAGG